MEDLKESDVGFYVWITNVSEDNGYGLDPTGMVPSLGGACDNHGYQKTALIKGPKEGVVSTAQVNWYQICHKYHRLLSSMTFN